MLVYGEEGTKVRRCERYQRSEELTNALKGLVVNPLKASASDSLLMMIFRTLCGVPIERNAEEKQIVNDERYVATMHYERI